MHITVSPFSEKRTIAQVHDMRRGKRVRPVLVRALEFAAKWTINRVLDHALSRIDKKNEQLTKHSHWFRVQTPEIRQRVKSTNAPVSNRLLTEVDGLLSSIGKDVSRLEKLAEDLRELNARQDIVYAVRRSVRNLEEFRHAVTEFREAGVGGGETAVCVYDAASNPRLEQAHAQAMRLAAQLRDGDVEFDPMLLSAATTALDKRTTDSLQRSNWARELVAEK